MDLEQEVNKGGEDANGAPISKFQRWSNRAQIVPGFIRYPVVVLALLTEGYCIYENIGPYYWISSLQAEIFDGSHFPMLSFLLSLIVVLIPAALMIRPLIPYYERKQGANNDIIDQLPR